jgi:uncharacterized protein (TIGR02266 family)
MADPNTRQGKRTPVTLKIKFKSETLEQFIERYAVDVSQGGIFIRTKEPLAVGTQMKFEFQLKDASPLIAGEGTVVWTRENDPSRPAIAPGMGVRFDRLAEGSQQVLEKILAEKAKQAPSRGSTDGPTKPPLFTDTPTKVAPVPVQDSKSGRNRHDSEQTPLPNPVPFHSDAEDFDEKAFEEATKVRSVDELVAATAAADDAATATMQLPPDELAARRHGRPDTPLAEPPPPVDPDSAPGLPDPPAGRPGRLLDTTPSPRSEDKRPSGPNLSSGAQTRLGVEPAKVATGVGRSRAAFEDRGAVPLAIPSDSAPHMAPRRPSSAPIIIAILVVVAAAVAGVWYFVLRDQVGEEDAVAKKPTKGSATAPVGTAGSAVATTGSAGIATTAGSAAAIKPTGPTFDTVIASSVPNATVEVEGTDEGGPAPFTAKLEKDKTYKVHVHATGFAPTTLDVKGGQDKVVAKLVAKPHVLAVTSEPSGAQVFIDSVGTGKATPVELELTAAQSAKAKLHVMLRKPGYRPIDQIVEVGSFGEQDAKLVAKLEVKMSAMVAGTGGGGQRPNGGGAGSATPTNTGAGSGAGSATTTGGNEGSGTTTPPPPPPPTGGGGSATGGEPEPDWTKKP